VRILYITPEEVQRLTAAPEVEVTKRGTITVITMGVRYRYLVAELRRPRAGSNDLPPPYR
jgi:hypothetical protein